MARPRQFLGATVADMPLLIVSNSTTDPADDVTAAREQAAQANLDPSPVQEHGGRRQFFVFSTEALPRPFKQWMTDYSLADWFIVQDTPDGPRVVDDSAAITRV